MNRSVFLRYRKVVVLAVAIPVLIVAAVSSGVSTASAAYPTLTATADCTAHVTFTATAWTGDGASADARTNNSVDIQYSTTGSQGAFTSIRGANAGAPSSDGKYVFNQANNFSFTDNFVLPSTVARPVTITLRAVALVKWGANEDQDVANETQDIAVNAPAPCSVPAATVTQPSCAVPNAQAFLRNTGGEDAQFHFFKDGSDQPFETDTVGGGQTDTVTLGVPAAYALSIHADNMAEVNSQLSPANCAAGATTTTTSTTSTTSTSTTLPSPAVTALAASVPTATAASACGSDALSWSVTLDNTASTVAQTFVVADNLGNPVDSVVVNPGKTLAKTYLFAGVTGTSIAVTVDGKTITTTDAKATCVNVGASIGTTCDTAGNKGALLGFTNTGKVDETFTVWRDNKPVQGSPFTISPSSLVVWKLLPLGEGQTADMAVKGNDGFSAEKSITLTCAAATTGTTTPPSVLAKTITRNGLAFTGIDLTPLVTFGIVLFALGFGLLYTSANLAVMSTLGGAKTEASGIRFDAAFQAAADRTRFWVIGLVEPKGKHARRRR